MTEKTLTRADLTEALHEQIGLTRQDCAVLVERTLILIAEAMERGEVVKLSGFGVFQVRSKRERMGRNPKTGEPAKIEAATGDRLSAVPADESAGRTRANPIAAIMKAPEAFRGIAEVADILGVRQHTLRAWETRFPFVRPVKRPDGRRYYRPADIALLRNLKRLLDEGMHTATEILTLGRPGVTAFAGPVIAAEESSGTIDRVGRLRSHFEALKSVRTRLAAALASSVGQGDAPAD